MRLSVRSDQVIGVDTRMHTRRCVRRERLKLLIVSAEFVAKAMEERGFEAGKADATKPITDAIKHNIAYARRRADFDAWSRGYVKGFDLYVP